jgi:cytochrome P450
MHHDPAPHIPRPFEAGFRDDPHPTYAQLRAAGPVHKITLPGGENAWLVTRYDDVRALLADPRLSSDPRHAHPDLRRIQGTGSTGSMLRTDDPDHRRLRRLVSTAFTARRVEQLRPRVRQIADDLLDALGEHGTVDLYAAFAYPLPLAVICDLFDVPHPDRGLFRGWASVMLAADPARRDQAVRARAELGAYLGDLIAARAAVPGEDLLSALVAARDGEDRLTHDEMVAMLTLLLLAGHETTADLIANGVVALLGHPDQLTALRQDRALIPGAVEEILRYDGTNDLAMFRFPTGDLTIGDTTVPAGDAVLLGLGSAGRDPGRFPAPDTLDVRRNPNPHLAFGHGIHHCLGAPLARLESQIALDTLLDRFPHLELTVAADALRWRDTLHWRGLWELPVAYATGTAPTGHSR